MNNNNITIDAEIISSEVVRDNAPTKFPVERITKKKVKKKKLNIFSHVSYILEKISPNKDIIFTYLEAFINNRPQTKENIALAYLYHIYSQMNPHEREHNSYEDMLELVTLDSSGRHIIEPSYLIAAISGGASICNVETAKTIAAVSASEVVSAMVREATREESSNHLDRKLLLEITGVSTQEQKGIVINNNHNITNQTANIDLQVGIPKYIGEVVSKDSVLREHYKKVLRANNEENR